MSARSALRGLGYVASELFDALWPGQAVRCALGRDYSRAVTRAAAAHDAVEALNEREAEQEVFEPRAQCRWCGGVDTPGHDCGRKYHESFAGAAASLADGTNSEPPSGGLGVCCVNPSVREDKQPETAGPQPDLSPVASARPGGSGEGDCGIRPPPPSPPLSFTAWAVPAIATILDAELVAVDAVWLESVAVKVAEHIEQSLTRNGQHVIVTQIYTP